MSQHLFSGTLTRLVAFDPDRGGTLYAKWYRDSEFALLYDYRPVRPRALKHTQEWMSKDEAKLSPTVARFHIETLAEHIVIGECELERGDNAHHEAEVAIGIGERDYWGRGYGSDALRQLLAFGFREWNLHRISLSTFDYNPRAIRSYEKVGFHMEGRKRGHMIRGGQRRDTISMGILRSEWDTIQNG